MVGVGSFTVNADSPHAPYYAVYCESSAFLPLQDPLPERGAVLDWRSFFRLWVAGVFAE